MPISTPEKLCKSGSGSSMMRSEEHTSELQSQFHLVCRLLLEKKKEARLHVLQGDVGGLRVECPHVPLDHHRCCDHAASLDFLDRGSSSVMHVRRSGLTCRSLQ